MPDRLQTNSYRRNIDRQSVGGRTPLRPAAFLRPIKTIRIDRNQVSQVAAVTTDMSDTATASAQKAC